MQHVNYVSAPSIYDCNFGVVPNAGTCRWTNDTTAVFNWGVKNHGTPSVFTGPDHDHTSSDGKSGLTWIITVIKAPFLQAQY
jgi:hypothetical protein